MNPPAEDKDQLGEDQVEIGDPVPEQDRTIKASRISPGEAGEDEDLPDGDGNLEESSGHP